VFEFSARTIQNLECVCVCVCTRAHTCNAAVDGIKSISNTEAHTRTHTHTHTHICSAAVDGIKYTLHSHLHTHVHARTHTCSAAVDGINSTSYITHTHIDTHSHTLTHSHSHTHTHLQRCSGCAGCICAMYTGLCWRVCTQRQPWALPFHPSLLSCRAPLCGG